MCMRSQASCIVCVLRRKYIVNSNNTPPQPSYKSTKNTWVKMGQSISSPVPVFAKECTELHKKYDQCFSTWYDKEFLKGESMENPCLDQWTEYMQCVNVALIKKGIRSIDTFDKDDLPDNIGEVLKEHFSLPDSNSENKP